jgi:hypothetical protein
VSEPVTVRSGGRPGTAHDNRATAERSYSLYQKGSAAALMTVLHEWGGSKVQVVTVTPGPLIRQAKNYRLFSAPSVAVRDAGRQERIIQPVGAILEHDGVCKVSTYFVTPKSSGR